LFVAACVSATDISFTVSTQNVSAVAAPIAKQLLQTSASDAIRFMKAPVCAALVRLGLWAVTALLTPGAG
jgi:hypothetical protein